MQQCVVFRNLAIFLRILVSLQKRNNLKNVCIVIENGTEQLCKYKNSQGQLSWVASLACNIGFFSQKMNKDFRKFFNSLRIKFELLENGLFLLFRLYLH